MTLYDVRITGGDPRAVGLLCNRTPLRRDAAEAMAERERRGGWQVEVVESGKVNDEEE